MPSPDRSTLYGRPKTGLKSTDEDDDDESENENEALPELVLGYARCHKHWWMDVITNGTTSKEQNNDTRHAQ